MRRELRPISPRANPNFRAGRSSRSAPFSGGRRGLRRDGGGRGGGFVALGPAFGLALGMDPVPAGFLASVPPLLAGGALQLLAPPRNPARTEPPGLVTICAAIQALAFIPLLIVILTGRTASGLVFASASLYWAAGMAAAAGWTLWTAPRPPGAGGGSTRRGTEGEWANGAWW